MSLSFYPLASFIERLDVLFDDMDRAWKALGRPGSIRPHLESKREAIRRGQLCGLLGMEGGRPMAISWVDLPHGNYGTVLFHTLREQDQASVAEACVRAKLLDGRVVELAQFHPGEGYRKGLRKMGLQEHFRQKMALGLDQPLPSEPPLLPEANFEPLQAEHAEIISEISCAAHALSRDLEGYPDFATPPRRAALERAIFSGLFGQVLGRASLLLRYAGEPVGACLVVGLSGWGYERVAWVLDMTVRPDFHGKGLGRAMLIRSLRGMVEESVPIAGLAVTQTNRHAVRLYEKTGFKTVEQFYEYIWPTRDT